MSSTAPASGTRVGPKAVKSKVGRTHARGDLSSLHEAAFARLRGSGFWDKFKDAFDPGKNGVGDAFNKVKNEFTNPDSVLARGATDAAQKVGHEFTDPDSILRGQVIPIAGQVANTLNKIPGFDAIPVLGQLSAGVGLASKINEGAKKLGLGKGIASRREVVARVMREQKLSLPAASAYVKAKGLWTKA